MDGVYRFAGGANEGTGSTRHYLSGTGSDTWCNGISFVPMVVTPTMDENRGTFLLGVAGFGKFQLE